MWCKDEGQGALGPEDAAAAAVCVERVSQARDRQRIYSGRREMQEKAALEEMGREFRLAEDKVRLNVGEQKDAIRKSRPLRRGGSDLQFRSVTGVLRGSVGEQAGCGHPGRMLLQGCSDE